MNALITANPRFVPVSHDPFTAEAGPELQAFVPLSEAQREIWLAAVLDAQTNLAYNEGLCLHLSGTLDSHALRAALQQLIDRHEALRSCISPDGQHSCVLSRLTLPLVEADLSDAADAGAQVAERQRAAMAQAFDLERGPLLRFELLRISEAEHRLIFVCHHIICDGWSAAVLLTELAQIYSARVQGDTPELPPAPRYGDYALLEQAFLRSAEGQAHEAYWLKVLDSPPPVLDLPLDKPRPVRRKFSASRIDRRLDGNLARRLRRAGAESGASLVSTMLAVFSSQLFRLTGAEDMVIGLSAAGQSLYQQPQLVGHCVNLLPLRLRPSADLSVTQMLQQTRQVVLDAYDHQGTTFGALLPKLDLERDESRPALISIVFNIDVRDDDIRHSGLEVDYETLVRCADNFEYYINIVDTGDDLILEFTYNSALFEAHSIERRLDEYVRLLGAVCEDRQQSLAALPMLTQAQRADLLAAPQVKDSPADLLHAGFARSVSQFAERVALRFEDQHLTYRQLDERSNQLAHLLMHEGVQPGEHVGLFVEPCFETVIGMLAILKCGAAYLPMDRLYPDDRLAAMLEDGDVRWVITQDALAGRLPGTVEGLRVDADRARIDAQSVTAPNVTVAPDALAYVIYTSGSTGVPKGCQLTHRNAYRLFTQTHAHYRFDEHDVWSLFHSAAFDVSVWEIWGALLHGGQLVVVPYWVSREPDRFLKLLGDNGVTVLCQTPSAFSQLIPAAPTVNWDNRLRWIIFAGEALAFDSLIPWLERYGDGHHGKGARMVNMYGITETTVHVTIRDIRLSECRDPQVSSLIGLPMPDLSIQVLDPRGEPVPLGVVGEMWVGGAGVARGYHKRPELNAQRFVEDRHNPGVRMYRSGDLARWLGKADGSRDELEYIGRMDHQVKLRGFRIELGEIEARLREHDRVREAHVQVLDAGTDAARLVAWLTPREAGQRADDASLRAHLAEHLPDHMVPRYFTWLPQFPLTSNGKLDRRKLPQPVVAEQQIVAPPIGEQEPQLAALWAELLKREQAVDRHARFADIGGHSMLAVRLAGRLQQLGYPRLPIRSLLFDSLAGVASAMAGAASQAPAQPGPRSLPRESFEAFYFGPPERQLYGGFHAGLGQRRQHAIVLAGSWGCELMRSHRGLFRLAIDLSKLGYDVLRFDWHGTGDSAGGAMRTSLSHWMEDLALAHGWLAERHGGVDIAVLGLRLGGLLAVHAQAQQARFRRLMLWDVPPSGAQWLSDLQHVGREDFERKNEMRRNRYALPPIAPTELAGHSMPMDLQRQLGELKVPVMDDQCLELQSADNPQPAVGRGPFVQLSLAGEWRDCRRLGSLWNVPAASAQIGRAISQWLP